MRISVAVITYNWPEALELVLRALASQTELPYEVIVTDDGSRPATRELLLRRQQGVFSIGTAERLSYYQAGLVWARVLGADEALVEPVEELASPRTRLSDNCLDTERVSALGIAVPTLEEDAAAHMRRVRTASAA